MGRKKKRKKHNQISRTEIITAPAKESTKNYEEYAYILDVYHKKGKSCACAIGDKYFKILELELKPSENPQTLLQKRVFVGEGNKREHVELVIGVVAKKEVPDIAQKYLDPIVYEIALDGLTSGLLKNSFLMFLNYASPRGLRLFGLRERNIAALITERDARFPMKFPDIRTAVDALNAGKPKTTLSDIALLLKNRILFELNSSTKDSLSILAFLSHPEGYIKSHAAAE